MKATLIMENGRVFKGESTGSQRERVCEMVFNTSMVGYQEILTDASYAGQGIVMTYPLIGNYGVNSQDYESSRPWPEALVVRKLSPRGSNFRSEGTLGDFLTENDITGISGVDTRAITRMLRDQGVMNGLITVQEDYDLGEKLELIKKYRVSGTVERVTCGQPRIVDGAGYKVALLDFGVKENIIRSLKRRDCKVTVLPAHTGAKEIISGGYNGLMLSNGPGDPADCVEIIAELKILHDSGMPVFGVCLGHQLMALATGGATHKLRYGHRGANHPVRDVHINRVFITSQNHGYVVDSENIDHGVAEISHVNINDNTVEGLRYKNGRVFTVQFHPEAAPGPTNTGYLFDRFMDMMGGKYSA